MSKNKKKNFFKTFACFSLVALSTSSMVLAAKNSQDFTNVISFGDSFVDGGEVKTYANTLAEKLGFAFQRNETNFASGGHGSANMVGGTFGGILFNSDLDNYLGRKGKFGSNDLVIYNPLSSEVAGVYDPIAQASGGIAGTFSGEVFSQGLTGNSDVDTLIANGSAVSDVDVFVKVVNGSLVVNKANFPMLFNYLDITESNTKIFVEKATLNGANYILISNHYNEALRQNFVGTKEFSDVISREIGKAQIRGASQVSGANIILWDEANLMQELADNPNKYLTTAEQVLGNYNLGPGNTSKIFDSTSHATQPVNDIKRQFVFSVITSPTLVSMLRESPLGFGMKTSERNLALAQNFANTGEVENNIAASADSSNSDNRFAIQVFGDFGKSHTGNFSKKELGFKDDSAMDAGLGLSGKINDNVLIGVRIGYAETKTKFVANRGEAKIREQAISIHGVYSFENPMFVYGSTGIGKLNYNITRDIALGLATHKEQGKTSGNHLFTTLGTGYRFNLAENISATPFVAGHYQSVTMKAYNDGSANGKKTSTQMSFQIPKRDSVMGEIGLTLASDFSMKESVKLIPSLTVSYLYDWKNPISKQVEGRNLSEYNYFKVPAYKIAQSNMQVQGSVLAEINNKYKIGFNASARPTGRVKSWAVGIRASMNL
jgi:uncharacterized protein YhjY with autotransporter beta-barrel domain